MNMQGIITNVLTDSLKIGGGFAVAGFAGRYVENKALTTPVTSTSSMTDKLIGWAANNAPKIVGYIALSSTSKDIASGMLGSAIVDSMLRYVNNGPNPINITIKDYRIMNNDNQKLIQENSVMRSQLNNTLQKIASMNDVSQKIVNINNIEEIKSNKINVQNLNTNSGLKSITILPAKSARNTGELLNTPISTATMFGMY